MDTISITKSADIPKAEINLSGSKSISNRLLIIRALSKKQFALENVSSSHDTVTLDNLLKHAGNIYDTGHAGTTFRFLCSFLALKKGTQTLTGSSRMLERPIGPLVDALKSLGFDIQYLGKEGYPPLQIGEAKGEIGQEVSMNGSVSSQFLSSLLLIAPYLPNGLKLKIDGDLVSKPYLLMTLNLMKRYGAHFSWDTNVITVEQGLYNAMDFYVEGDWSSASYIYLCLSLQNSGEIRINGLQENSLQGDSKIAEYAENFGIVTEYQNKAVLLKKAGSAIPPLVEFNLIEQPDLCQTLVAMCAAQGVQGIFSGIQTLKIKETDRIAALSKEMTKLNVSFVALPKQFSAKSADSYYMLNGKISPLDESLTILTYEDHRMAMAFAPLSKITPLGIENPLVVNKSYTNYWEDLAILGYLVE